MRRTTSLLALAAVTLVPAASPVDAGAARTKAAKPKITRVTPMRINVGETLVIRGSGFKSRPRANTVVFQGTEGRTAFAKPRRATRRKLVVKIPANVSRLLVVKDSRQAPTRLKLRVLAGRFSAFTPRRLSPVVLALGAGRDGLGGTGGDGTGAGALAVCKTDGDHDDDLLSNDDEIRFGTDPCLRDTDKDGSSDGWEFYAAKDLNLKAVPYPERRPYPNALDPSDRDVDFDGDGLDSGEEYRAWVVTGSAFDPGKESGTDLESPLGYSDGTQFSRASEPLTAPAWYGAPPPQAFPDTYNLDRVVPVHWSDNERDADRDGLSNWLESKRGPGRPEWWPQFWSQEKYGVEPWPKRLVSCGQAPGAFDERPFASLDLADGDVDGDRLLDGEDDQDNDDITNIVELYETVYDLDGDGQSVCGFPWVPSVQFGGESRVINAFNPCAPNPKSRSCPRVEPF